MSRIWGLKDNGPFDQQESPELIRLGLVGPTEEIAAVRAWLPRLNGMLVSREGNSRCFRDYPGAARALSARSEVTPQFVRTLDEPRWQAALATRNPNGQ